MNSVRCGRCHRWLKDPHSCDQGYGPVCIAFVRAEDAAQSAKTGDLCDLPFDPETMDIVCRRDGDPTEERGVCHFNFPQRVVIHSPSGMEWGYSGSGPADFALNALLCFVDRTSAEILHQDFKFQFVASLDRRGDTIKGSDINAWIAAQNERVADVLPFWEGYGKEKKRG